jgi:hypothetical protein
VSSLSYRLESGARSITMRGPRYIPFDHRTPEQDQARKALQTALSSMRAGNGEVMHATHRGPRPHNTDVENILLYDSGSKCFTSPARHGIWFEGESASAQSAECEYRYTLVRGGGALTMWHSLRRLAVFDEVDLALFPGEVNG